MEVKEERQVGNTIFKIVEVQKDYFVYSNSRSRNFKADKNGAKVYFDCLVLDAELMLNL